MICCTYFSIQWQLDVDVLGFSIRFFLYVGYSFGHISNIWAIFFHLLVTVPLTVFGRLSDDPD
jgi:hypothetical protein